MQRREIERQRRGLARLPTARLTAMLLCVLCCACRSEPVDLEAAERQVFSQFGEDGVIERIFELIEPGPKFAVEFGAADGLNGSNVRNLVVNHGWASLQIEGDPGIARRLEANYADFPSTRTVQAWVWPGNVELLFADHGVPRDLDLLVIDIDSNDWYVWRAIRDYRPKVVVIETNPLFPPTEPTLIEFHPMNYWDGSDYFGASLQSYVDLAETKGYELVHHMSNGVNAIFVDAAYFARFGIADNSTRALHRHLSDELRERLLRTAAAIERDPNKRDTLTWETVRIEKRIRRSRTE